MYLSKISLLVMVLLSILLVDSLVAQDTTNVQQDTIKPKVKKKFFEKFRVSGLRVGLDLVPPAIFIFDQDFRNFEASAELVLNQKFYLAADIGIDRTIREGESYRYQSSGSYFRLGMDYNLWHKNRSGVGTIFLLGLHVGFASLKHELNYQSNNVYWEGTQENLEFGGLSAGWVELKSGLRAKITPNFYIGPIARLKIRFSSGESQGLEIHDVPGYGLNNSIKIRVGYQLLYQIPLSKTK